MDLLEACDPREARRILEEAAFLQPTDPDLRALLAVAFAEEGDSSRALSELEVALALDPHCREAQANRAVLLLLAGRRAEGMAALRDLGRGEPPGDSGGGRAALHCLLGDLYRREGRLTDALQEYLRACREDSGRREVRLRLARAYADLGLLEDATREAARAEGLSDGRGEPGDSPSATE